MGSNPFGVTRFMKKKVTKITKTFEEEIAERTKALYEQFIQKGFNCEQSFELTKLTIRLNIEDYFMD
jgi:hypothetical protein